MKRPKISISGAGLKAFFFAHFEKLMLGGVLLASLVLFYLGYNVKGYDKQPGTVQNSIVLAKEKIAKAKPLPIDIPKAYVGTVTTVAVTDAMVPFIKEFSPTIGPQRTKRRDPKILSPTDMRLVGHVAPVAYKKKNPEETSALDELRKQAGDEPAPPVRPMRGGRGGGEPLAAPPRNAVGQEARSMLPEDRQAITGGASFSGGGESIPRVQGMVVGKMLVPYQLQFQEFQDMLAAGTPSYSLTRDVPHYDHFQVERADVTANPAADPAGLTWTDITKEIYELSVSPDLELAPEELIANDYLLENISLKLPPVLLTDIGWLTAHGKDIPTKKDIEALMKVAGSATASGPTTVPAPLARRGGPATQVSPLNHGRGPVTSTSAGVTVTPYKLLRFTDFGVERGHKYRYRVRVVLEDPNHPPIIRDPSAPTTPVTDPGPPPGSLDPSVEERLKTVAAREVQTKTERIGHIESAWSEVGPVVNVPDPLQLAAGEVTSPARELAVGGARIPVVEAKAKALVVSLDDRLAAQIVSEEEVERGSVLNYVAQKVDALDPLRFDFVNLNPPYNVKTGAFVVDIRGGEKFAGKDPKEPLLAPAQIVVVDQYGNLIVREEAEDLQLWHRYGKVKTPPPGNLDDRAPAARGGRRGNPENPLDQPAPRGGRGGRERRGRDDD